LLSPPNIDVERFRPLGLVRDINVLYVGPITASKGYYNLVERFGRDGITFVGRNHMGMPLAGHHIGEVAYDDLPSLYNRARVLAHLPIQPETMGRTVVEASLCGCEVVTNDRVGVTSYPLEVWTDPSVVRNNGHRFWEQLEQAVDWVR
jgi:glycosyltransferase involved in cell wall biosynthesis